VDNLWKTGLLFHNLRMCSVFFHRMVSLSHRLSTGFPQENWVFPQENPQYVLFFFILSSFEGINMEVFATSTHLQYAQSRLDLSGSDRLCGRLF